MAFFVIALKQSGEKIEISTVGMTRGGRHELKRGRSLSTGTSVLAPASLPFVWVMKSTGLISPSSLWIVIGFVLFAFAANIATARRLAQRPDSILRLHARVAAGTIATATVIHSLGWGTILIIAYLFTALELAEMSGSRVTRIVMGWTAAVVFVGQLGITVGWVPSVMEVTASNVAALCCTATVLTLIHMFGGSAARAERAEQELAVKARHYESLVRHADDVIGVIDDHGTVLTANPAVERILGFSLDDLVGRRLTEFGRSQPMESVKAMIDGVSAAVANEDVPVVTRCTLRHRDGTDRHLVITFTTPSVDWSGKTILNIHDTTTQHQLEQQLRFEATHDPLTGLLNRKAFADHVHRTCRQAAQNGHGVTMLFLDLDGFKTVNDSCGHETGDRVLVEAASRVAGVLAPGEVLARLGGDEFCILLEAPNPTRAVALAERIVATVCEPICGLPPDIRVGVSIGIAERSHAAEGHDTLMIRADQAMYEAKRRGKAGYVVAERLEHAASNGIAT